MLANQAPAPDDDLPLGDSDYDTILAALTGTARGRSFLQEYARRNRSADTAMLLAAIGRIEGLLQTGGFQPDAPADAVQAVALSEPSSAEVMAADLAEIGDATAAAAIDAAEVTFATGMDVATNSATRVVVSGGYHAQAGAAVINMPGIDFVDDTEPDGGVTVAEVALPANDAIPVPHDPFADIRALSDEEKIALFT